jgi:phosphate transport system substrate-binding protein
LYSPFINSREKGNFKDNKREVFMVTKIRNSILTCSVMFSIIMTGCSESEKARTDATASASVTTKTSIPVITTSASVVASPIVPKSEPTPTNSLGITREDFKRLDGSTATIPLTEAAAADLLGINSEEARKVIHHNTTHFAYERLIKKEADIIFVTEPSEGELALAKDSNVEIEVVPVVKDAFVFLVNKKNAVESLTVKQIQDIYSGKLTNWNQVGGKTGGILAYQRPENSGSQTLMLSKVMKGIPMVKPEKNMEPAGMGDLIEVVAGFDNSEFALGYSVYYYANTMYTRDTIKLIGVDGVKPDPSAIKSDKYPLTSAYYAVVRKNEPEGTFASKLLKWILSEQGQKVAEKAGYIPLK